MMAKELEPSTLAPLIACIRTGLEYRHRRESRLADDLRLGGVVRIAVLEQPVDRKGALARQEIGFDRIFVGRHRARVGQAIVDGLLHPGQDLNALVIVEDRLAAGIQERSAVAEQQHGEVADDAFLLIPRPDDREFGDALLP